MIPPGEQFLRERGVLTRTSPAMNDVMGCLACRWSRGAAAYPSQIAECTSRATGTIVPKLAQLHNAGLIERIPETGDPNELKRPLRTLYRPADTIAGAVFASLIEPPTNCNLNEQPQATEMAKVDNRSTLPDTLEQSIAELSTATQLAQVVKLAMQRLAELE